MPDLVPIRRALLSVSDKSDLVAFASVLTEMGVELVSTGGTARALAEAGLAVRHIEDLTGFPEMMDGRLKTLHPKVHGGLLALRDKPSHVEAMNQHGIPPIDLVCVNLYPFEQTVGKPGVTTSEAIENIDIGGPAMIRSAAKNAAWVAVVTDPRQYDRVVEDLRANSGAASAELRRWLAAAAFARTSAYDRAISAYLDHGTGRAFPSTLTLDYALVDELRYGENPHQAAAVYRDPASSGPTVVNAHQICGKHLSYNNFLDASAALELVKMLRRHRAASAGACVIKHTNPCGVALADKAADAVQLAISGDPLAAYGGILAVNRPIDDAAAEHICRPDRFFEVILAPEFMQTAAERIAERWKSVRLLAVGERPAARQRKLEYRAIPGGMLVQDRDVRVLNPADWTHAAGPAPDPTLLAAAPLVELAVRALSSNAVAIGGPVSGPNGVRLFGAGAGQMDRVACSRLAVEKAAENARGAVAASDAFFPFPDGPEILIDAGVKMLVHPGGSKRDADTFELCNERGVTCMTTGVRRFRH
ncbi:MAG: bifunctional phosphoribosylaminoimidazolecarboxamide formyltransferase/IMP cyclohydrolase [Phycisphaeraceae bacterium]|nr:MAG: bifunctional phosphoribosylaminoimidazolecarboxamide formyltransferase/IMP cyclohydrolase [Phycisphaeraceae bacterium]